MPNKPNPEQGELVVVSTNSGQSIARDFDAISGDWQTDPEVNLHFQNVVSGLIKMNMLRPFVSIDEIAERQYGEEADKKRNLGARALSNLIVSTKIEFARATGHYRRIDDGHDRQQVKNDTRQKFSDFIKQYGGSRNSKNAQQFRKQLIARFQEIFSNDRQQVEDEVTDFNRDNGLRPHGPFAEPEADNLTSEQKRQARQLETRVRMQAVQGDPRAGFMPKTNHAKNLVIGWLDYLDNPKFPRGIRDQLGEVFTHNHKLIQDEHQFKTGNLPLALRGLESITWEVGDHAIDAHVSLLNMMDLREKIAEEPGAQVRLADVFPEGHPGLAVLIRHRALEELMITGDVKGLKNPYGVLRTIEDPPESRRQPGIEPGKRKTLLNQFTRPKPTKKYAKYMEHQIENLRIGQIRSQLDDIVDDLTNESLFLKARLADVVLIDDNMKTKENFDYEDTKMAAETALREIDRLHAVA